MREENLPQPFFTKRGEIHPNLPLQRKEIGKGGFVSKEKIVKERKTKMYEKIKEKDIIK